MNMLFIEMKICEITKDSALSVKLDGLLSALSYDLGSKPLHQRPLSPTNLYVASIWLITYCESRMLQENFAPKLRSG